MSVANNECEGSQKTRKIKMLDFDFLGRLPLFRYALHDRSICIITIFIALLNLNRSLVFYFKSFFHVLSLRERTKAPGTREKQSDGSLFRSCKQHPSVKPSLPLKLSF